MLLPFQIINDAGNKQRIDDYPNEKVIFLDECHNHTQYTTNAKYPIEEFHFTSFSF